MKYFKYVFGLFLALFTLTIFVPSVKAEDVPVNVHSIYREATFWEKLTTSGNQLLVKSNRFYISDFYEYFLFDLKGFIGSNPGGHLGGSQGIAFFDSSTSISSTELISFNDLDFNNFVDLTSYTNRWIEFRLVLTIQGTDTENSLLANLNNNPRYALNVLGINGSGLIVQTDLYEYLNSYVETIISGRINYAFQSGYDDAKNEFGYNYNGTIITGNSAYLTGYQTAIEESGNTKTSIINFIPGVLGAIFMFFFQIGQIGILGITILDVLGILVLISSLIFIIKFFF